MIETIDTFQVSVKANQRRYNPSVIFNCRHKNESIRFIPEMETDAQKRKFVKQYAKRWQTDSGRYCFTTDIGRLSEMIDQNGSKILFNGLSYMCRSQGRVSHATVIEKRASVITVGGFYTKNDSGHAIKFVLKTYGVSMTGRKEQLVDKLAQLATEVYQKEVGGLESFFLKNSFIRVPAGPSNNGKGFPLLKGHDLRNMVLTMFILKHLRGNTILDAAHENDTFDLLSLARFLVQKQVSLHGGFMRAQ